MMIAKKRDDSDSEGAVLTLSSEKSCEAWLLELARFMQHQRRSGSRHTLRRMMVLGDDSDYRIIGVGDIKFKMCDGREMLFKGVK